MAATMLASIDTIVEALGGPIPKSVFVDSGDRQIVATNFGSQAFLVAIAPKAVSRSVVRETIRELVSHLTAASTAPRRKTKGSARPQRVNVRPRQ
jgi:predicted regulator of Ras-like GTPase activity (Roadblock/LC7/MglB family)